MLLLMQYDPFEDMHNYMVHILEPLVSMHVITVCLITDKLACTRPKTAYHLSLTVGVSHSRH